MGLTLNFSYDTMKKSSATAKGMKIIEGDITNLRASIKEDIVYVNKSNKDLHLRILRPESIQREEDRNKYPVYVHVQGSAYLKQNLNDHVMDLKEIVTAGYVVIIVEYRESHLVKMPGQVYDVKDAMRYIYKHHKELCIDIDRIYLSGDSSGGHASLICWATWPTELLDGSNDPLPPVRAFLDFYGAVDMLDILNHPSAFEHRGAGAPEEIALGGDPLDPAMAERLKETSVLTYIDEAIENAPLLILHGNKDRLVPFEQSILLYNVCMKANKNATFYCVNNADHGGSAFYCRETYKIILDFLNSH